MQAPRRSCTLTFNIIIADRAIDEHFYRAILAQSAIILRQVVYLNVRPYVHLTVYL